MIVIRWKLKRYAGTTNVNGVFNEGWGSLSRNWSGEKCGDDDHEVTVVDYHRRVIEKLRKVGSGKVICPHLCIQFQLHCQSAD
jgi:hypothetical protein